MRRVREKQRKRIRRKRHIRKKIVGTVDRPRLSIYKSNKRIYLQVIDDEKSNTLLAASTLEDDLKDLRVNKESGAKIGELIGKRMAEKNIKAVVFDRNGYKYHGVVKAVADGARKAGVRL
jgi:large subunit ribosomal protein L18